MSRDFTITRARYAKGLLAVHITSDGSGFATWPEFLARDHKARYTHRERAYLMSKTQARKFVKAYAQWKYRRLPL